ncbi:F-box domain, cyclin-like protein [Artemisia annua]|uniref:F-box domain, cyclin-like protein n=1 Tax=Artemisia annua TaxID=35608 RepID=A0A2U1MG08_ARTAN|nr:F-box domain, cyclin-like protein [Artemisia annua]
MARYEINVSGASVSSGSLEKIQENIINEILSKLEDETEILSTLCTLTCVSQTLQSTINEHLFLSSSIDLSSFSMDSDTLNGISRRFGKMKQIKLDCFFLDELSIRRFLGVYVEELILVLSVELSDFHKMSVDFADKLRSFLRDCRYLESLEIKVRMEKRSRNESTIPCLGLKFPQTVKVLKLDMRVLHGSIAFGPTLTHISLVLDLITNVIVLTIAQNCPLLVELELIDIPTSYDELSDIGIQSLVHCRHLSSLSIVRKWQFVYAPFARATQVGLILLSKGCKGLESVRLHGLGAQSKVQSPLVELKLVSCTSITCQGVHELVTLSTSLEVIDFHGCHRIADSCLSNISCLTSLTSLNLGSTNVTDDGMAVLGKGKAPISCLSLRGCKKVTDEGITFLLGNGGKIGRTLSSLDLGDVFKITDKAITVIADACAGLVELCVRNCFIISDEAMKTLVLRGRHQPESKLLRRLDIFNCPGVSEESFEYLKKPLFRGLQWIGIKESHLIRVGDAQLAEIHRERPWLTICKDGCEVGCHDGWQSHGMADY